MICGHHSLPSGCKEGGRPQRHQGTREHDVQPCSALKGFGQNRHTQFAKHSEGRSVLGVEPRDAKTLFYLKPCHYCLCIRPTTHFHDSRPLQTRPRMLMNNRYAGVAYCYREYFRAMLNMSLGIVFYTENMSQPAIDKVGLVALGPRCRPTVALQVVVLAPWNGNLHHLNYAMQFTIVKFFLRQIVKLSNCQFFFLFSVSVIC